MRMLSAPCGSVVLACTLMASGSAQTRAAADAADPLRRCAIARDSAEPADRFALRCAERFVVEQGYTELPGLTDTTLIVPEASSGVRQGWNGALNVMVPLSPGP